VITGAAVHFSNIVWRFQSRLPRRSRTESSRNPRFAILVYLCQPLRHEGRAPLLRRASGWKGPLCLTFALEFNLAPETSGHLPFEGFRDSCFLPAGSSSTVKASQSGRLGSGESM